MDLNFRKLRADEIDVRIGTAKYENPKDHTSTILGASYLLYKNARVDMALLDEEVGAFNWQRTHEFKDGKLYCSVGIYDEDKEQWVWKEDVGVESNTEAEKGQASDSFKRACFNWGIGRELYTSPFIWIKPTSKEDLKYAKFYVKEIEYTKDVISKLVIIDKDGNVRFSFGSVEKPVQEKLDTKLLDEAKALNIDLGKVATYLKKNVDDLTNADLTQCIEQKKKALGGKK